MAAAVAVGLVAAVAVGLADEGAPPLHAVAMTSTMDAHVLMAV